MQNITRYLTICFSILFITLPSCLTAQNVPSKKPDQNGVYLGASLLGASWEIPDIDFGPDYGGGFGLKIGYDFNTNLGAFISADGSNMDPDEGEDYVLAHFTLGLEGRLGNYKSTFRPFARVVYSGMSAQSDDVSGDTEINGAGPGLGVGAYFFVNNNVAFDVGYTYTWINLTEVKQGSNSTDVDTDANTGRFEIGVSYHF